MKKIFLIAILVILTLGNKVSAEESNSKDITPGTSESQTEEFSAEERHIYKFPDIKPDASFYGGYRFVHLNGSPRAEEFEYLHNSISLGWDLKAFPFPHRLGLHIDVKNRKDYFGDVNYAFKDIVIFRGINRTSFHNLDNIRLIDLDTGTASPGVDVRDKDKEYGVKTGMNSVLLRLKMPDFPFHIYIDSSLTEKDGTQQQRSLSGSGYFNNLLRTSQSRDIDWKTENIIIGANSHLGPIEVDISHGEKRFDVSGDKVLSDTYTAATSTPARAAGTYQHNLIPELKGSSNTIKLHTSYTGSLVASTTFSKIERENIDSGAKADYFIGAGEVVWMPLTKLIFFLKYRHKEADIDNPDNVTITDRSNPANTYAYQVKKSISSVTDSVSGLIRHKPISGLTLKAEYSYEDIRRKDAGEWDVPQSTQKNTASLSADIKIIKSLKLKAKYTHKNIHDPASNIEPDHSDEGRISVTWIPMPRLNTLVSYIVAREKRGDLHFLDENEQPVQGTENRDVNRDRLLGSITFLILKDLSLTTSYSYMHNKTKQDIVFSDTSGIAHVNSSVPNKDIANSYALDINYLPKNNISLAAGVNHTISRGIFYPSDDNLLQPVSIASFSELKTQETVYSVSGEYKFKGGFASGFQCRYSRFDDVLDNPNDDVQDGRAHIILLTMSKTW